MGKEPVLAGAPGRGSGDGSGAGRVVNRADPAHAGGGGRGRRRRGGRGWAGQVPAGWRWSQIPTRSRTWVCGSPGGWG
jgi:hypothetical protein